MLDRQNTSAANKQRS